MGLWRGGEVGRCMERWDGGRWEGREVHGAGGMAGDGKVGRWSGGMVGDGKVERWREEVSMRVARVIL